ncbi:Trefoil factor 3 [Varanus komodoensis]|nr:Trefoil factor 3 [Varanus komodoensis]
MVDCLLQKRSPGPYLVVFSAPAPGVCNVPGRLRQNCGFPGITELECSALQCCFDSNQIGVPWCYQPIQEDEYFRARKGWNKRLRKNCRSVTVKCHLKGREITTNGGGLGDDWEGHIFLPTTKTEDEASIKRQLVMVVGQTYPAHFCTGKASLTLFKKKKKPGCHSKHRKVKKRPGGSAPLKGSCALKLSGWVPAPAQGSGDSHVVPASLAPTKISQEPSTKEETIQSLMELHLHTMTLSARHHLLIPCFLMMLYPGFLQTPYVKTFLHAAFPQRRERGSGWLAGFFKNQALGGFPMRLTFISPWFACPVIWRVSTVLPRFSSTLSLQNIKFAVPSQTFPIDSFICLPQEIEMHVYSEVKHMNFNAEYFWENQHGRGTTLVFF